MTFAVRILPVTDVADVPNSDFLSVNRVLGYDAVTNKLENGHHRFAPGERVIYVPEGSQIPEALLREHGYWSDEEGKGRLAGPNGDVVRPVTLRKQLSTGLLWKLPPSLAHLPDSADVASYFGITQYVPEVPEALLRVARPLFDAKTNYDIERLKMYPDLLINDEVVLTEKLEGENIQATWMGGERHEELFLDGHVAITTKGLGGQGLVFKDNEDSRKIPVVRAALQAGIPEKLAKIARELAADRRVRLFSEAIGPGVKKLHYGASTPVARAFDIRVEDTWIDEGQKDELFKSVALDRVPVLWRGHFDARVIETFRQGNTTIGGSHIREGVVITAVGDQSKRTTSLGDSIRPILKAHSDAFLKKFGMDD